MTEESKTFQQNEVCTINVVFPVKSDEEALAVKSKLKDALQSISGARLDLRITSIPSGTLPRP